MESTEYAKLCIHGTKKVAGYSYLVNKTLKQVFEDENNNKQRQATTKNSVEKCQKKVSKQFKS